MVTMVAGAQSNSEIKCQWAKLIDGKTSGGDQLTEVCVGKNGSVYWLGTYGTTSDAPDIAYDGETIYTGALTAGTSQNNNYTLIKTDSNGNKEWVVYSNSGDFTSGSGGMAVTSDGGVVTVTKARHSSDMQDKDLTIIDAAGTTTNFGWPETVGATRVYKILVTKVSTTGEIEWNRLLDVSTVPGAASTAELWPDAFNLGNLTVDSEDNIYMILNLKNTLSVPKSDGTTATVNVVNNKTWTGETQQSCGDFVIIGLDKDGYYRNDFALEGTAAVGYGQRITYADGYLYAQGYINGDGTTLKAGEIVLAPTEIISPVIVCLDTNLNVSWAKCFAGEEVAGKKALQNTDISVVAGNVWFCGMFNLKFTDPEDATKTISATQGSAREGFIVKLDAASGRWLASRGSREDEWNNPSATAKTGLTGYLKVLQNNENPKNIYVAGYVMNANVGVFLREYDATTLEANLTTGQNNIITKGGVPSYVGGAYDAPNCAFYVAARGNNVFGVKDGDDTAKPEKWGIVAAKFTLPAEMLSAVENIVVDNIATDAPAEYYDLSGRRVFNPATGLYIVRRGNTVEKVYLK